MAGNSIIIVDSNENRSDFFESLFMRDDYDVPVYGSLATLSKENKESAGNSILLEYNTLVNEERQNVVDFFSSNVKNNLFVYNVPDNANKRLAFYELGARRVFDSSQPGEEIYYALAWPLKNLRGELDKNALFSSGRLEDVSLKTLLSNLAREERTGILKMVTAENSGKIYFTHGQVTHAQVGVHSGEKALMHMLFWHQGTFQFIAGTGRHSRHSVQLSNVALLIEAEKLRQSFIEDLKDIGPLHSVVRLQYAGDLANSSIEVDAAFIKLIERPLRLSRALENPVYTSAETAAILRQLKAGGFLSVRQPAQPVLKEYESQLIASNKISTLFSAEETLAIVENLDIAGEDNAKVAVVSSAGQGSLDFICKIAGVENSESIITGTYLAHVKLSEKTRLMLFSLSMDKNILPSIERLTEGLAAFVFLIDAAIPEKFEYISYAVNQLNNLYEIPWIAAVFNLSAGQSLNKIKKQLTLPKHVPFLECEPKGAEAVKKLMLQLKPYEEPEPEEEPQDAEDESEEMST